MQTIRPMALVQRAAVLLLLAAATTGAAAQQPYPNERYPSQYDEQQVDTFRPATRVPEDGFFPTTRQVYLIIDRITDDMAIRYDFDDEQLERTRVLIRETVPKWMETNKAELKLITNQWMDAMLAGKPPSAEYVAGLATRIQPLLHEFHGLIEETTEVMQNKMTAWSEGQFDPSVEWPGGPHHYEAERQSQREVQAAMAEARVEAMGPNAPVVPVQTELMVEPAPPPGENATAPPAAVAPSAVPGRTVSRAITDEWERYVEDFIARYKLDAQQSERARRHLRVAQEDRDAYLRRRGEELKRAEQALAGANGESDKQAARASLERVRRPIERQLEKLKENLEKLPTRDQRAAAARTDSAATPSAAAPAAPRAGRTDPPDETQP
jgi:hypothetical protein